MPAETAVSSFGPLFLVQWGARQKVIASNPMNLQMEKDT